MIGNNDKFRELSVEYSKLEPVVTRYREYQALLGERTHAKEMMDGNDADPARAGPRRVRLAECRASSIEEGRAREAAVAEGCARREQHRYLEIRAGTGGDEAAIFAGDLFRMYSRYAEQRGWRVESALGQRSASTAATRKSSAASSASGAFSYFKFEAGTHRVQRVPATEAQGRIHTSACTVAILPELAEIEAIDLNPAELRVDTFRASRRRRSARQQDRLGDSHHALADRNRRRMSGRALAAQESLARDVAAEGAI